MAYIPPLNGGRINASLSGNNTAGALAAISTGTMYLAGGNNITLSQNANSLTISAANAIAQSNQTLGFTATGNTVQNTTATFDARFMTLNGLGAASVGFSNGSIQISGATTFAASNHSHGNPTLNLTNLSGTTASASNGLTLSLSGPTMFDGGVSNAVAGGSTFGTMGTNLTGGLIFYAGSNIGLSQSTDGGSNASITIQAANGGAGGAAFSAGTQSVNTGTVNFANSNGVTFGMSGSNQITASVAAGGGVALYDGVASITSGTGRISAGGALTASINGQTLSLNAPAASSLVGVNGISIATSGNTISISGPTIAPSLINFSAGTTSGNIGSVVFNNSNGMSFGLNGSAITASYAGGGGGVALVNGAQTYSSGSVNLVASGALTLSSPNASSLNLSVPATSSIVGVNGISVSGAGGIISIDGAPLATLAGGFTLSYYNPQDAYVQINGQQGQGTLHMQPTPIPNVSFDRIIFPLIFTGASNSTASISLSMYAGIYTRNALTLSLLSSFSTSNALTHSGTANSSQNVGLKMFTMGGGGLVTEGAYFFGILSRSASAGGNASISQILASQQATNLGGFWGQAPNASIQYTRGLGTYSATLSSMPSSVAFSDLRGTGSNVLRQPMFYLVNGTV